MPNYVRGEGPVGETKLMIVGEAPGSDEDRLGRPFVGQSGDFLWEVLGELGITRNNVYVTNAFKYRPPGNNIKLIHQVCDIEEQKHQLREEIKYVNPNCILCLGETALSVVTGIKGILKWRGSILKDRTGIYKVVGTIHPANIIRQADGNDSPDFKVYPYIWKHIFQMDCSRAIQQSAFPESRRTEKYIKTCRDSVELFRYLERNKNRNRMVVDIESVNCIPVCVGLAFDRHEALVVPLWNKVGKVEFAQLPDSDRGFIWQHLDKAFREKDLVGQNAKYDQDKLQMLGFGFKKPRPFISDTMLKAHTINPEYPTKSMQFLQSIYTEQPYHKDEGKEFNLSKDKPEKLFHYNGLDCVVTYELDEEMEPELEELTEHYQSNGFPNFDLKKFYYDYVMQLHQVYMDIENVGFRVDYEAKEFLKQKYQARHDMVQARMKELLGDYYVPGKKCHDDHPVNVAAPGQIKYLLYKHLGIPMRKDASEETLVALANNVIKDDKRKNILSSIVEDRRIRKTLGTYILVKPDYDGRIRGSYRITGTETGRSSTAILKQPLRPYKTGHAFQTLTKHGDIGADLRTLYIPDDGFVFVQADLSQAEPRIVALLSEDWELLNAFESGKVDIHRRTAALVLGMTSTLDLSEAYNEIADVIGKDSPERFLGKKSRNGGNYNMQKRRLMIEINTDAKRFGIDIQISEWRAGQMIDNFHAASIKVKGVFHRDVENAINETRSLINPYGRLRRFFERLNNETYKEGYATLPQGTVADHLKHAILGIRSELPDTPIFKVRRMILGEAHDALLTQMPKGEYMDRCKVMKKWMETPIDFNNCSLKRDYKLVIPADFEIGEKNYKDLVKFKVE